jgi:predicted Zn-dependent protease
MGHALDVLKHSDDRQDLMNPSQPVQTPYPWVTQRDLNTMGHAYCRWRG